jgi:hypothetical protein
MDPGSGMGKNQDPGSGLNIPDPHHWLKLLLASTILLTKPETPFSNLLPRHCSGSLTMKCIQKAAYNPEKSDQNSLVTSKFWHNFTKERRTKKNDDLSRMRKF